MSHPYVKGRAFEYRVRDYLKKKGFFVVRQARSAFPDLIALKKSRVVFVECKVDGRLSKREREELLAILAFAGGEGFLALRKGRKLLFRSVKIGTFGRGRVQYLDDV